MLDYCVRENKRACPTYQVCIGRESVPTVTLSTVPPTHQEFRCLSAERIWRTRYKPPNEMGTVQCPSAEVISTKNNTSVRCSLLYNAVLVLPILLASSGRIINTHCRNDELVWRVRKPPNITGRRLLLEAINKIKGGRERAHLPVFRPTSAPYARSPASWLTFALLAWNCFHTAFASIIHCYLREAPVILHANGKSWL